MAYNPQQPNWFPVTGTQAHALTCSTVLPGQVFPFPVTDLPAPLQKMNPVAAFISGHQQPYAHGENVTVQGALAVGRDDKGQGKGYVYHFAVSCDESGNRTVVAAGPDKPYGDRYYDTQKSFPIEHLFGNAQLPTPACFTRTKTD